MAEQNCEYMCLTEHWLKIYEEKHLVIDNFNIAGIFSKYEHGVVSILTRTDI